MLLKPTFRHLFPSSLSTSHRLSFLSARRPSLLTQLLPFFYPSRFTAPSSTWSTFVPFSSLSSLSLSPCRELELSPSLQPSPSPSLKTHHFFRLTSSYSSRCIFYKFKSQKAESRLPIDGTGISVFELKKEIILANHMGEGKDFDLGLFEAAGNEEGK